jgi:hypothetical protein
MPMRAAPVAAAGIRQPQVCYQGGNLPEAAKYCPKVTGNVLSSFDSADAFAARALAVAAPHL